jgi:CRP-like cAMP-binding protein
MIKTIEQLLQEHPFFAGMNADFLKIVVGCAGNTQFNKGDYIFREGEKAEKFYVIRKGTVGLEISLPGRTSVTVQNLGEGEVIGWSWLFPPYRWTSGARALEAVSAVALDGECLRGKCDKDHDLGYDLMKRFVQIVINRLTATRMQLLDIYGSPR